MYIYIYVFIYLYISICIILALIFPSILKVLTVFTTNQQSQARPSGHNFGEGDLRAVEMREVWRASIFRAYICFAFIQEFTHICIYSLIYTATYKYV